MARRLEMDYTVWLVWMAVVVNLLILPTSADWDQDCPKLCKCTYVSNRKLADCRDAGFSTIPTTLSPEIQELNLANNRIEYLEKDAFKAAGLVNLQKLYLEENEIHSIHKDAFRDLKILIELDLKKNRIDKLHPHTFTGMEKLRVLDLSLNQLSRLDGVQFPVLPHLRKLIFTDNKISYINNYAFINLNLLNSLRLSGNRLKLVQPDLFTNNSQLVELELHGNPWECDCHLKDLVRWVKQKSLLQEHVTCYAPERVSGRKWESVIESELACRPELILPQTEVPVVPGQNASLTCRAVGDPLPQIKWVLSGRVLTNMSVTPFSQTEQRYVLNEVVEGGERWSQLTITNVADYDLTFYTCVADNLAGLVEQNVSLIAAAPTLTGAITPKAGLDLYIIIAIATGGLILLIIIIALIFCCCRRRQHKESKPTTVKVNGVASGSHIEHKNVMIVNPVEKPPRKYEQVPQNDMELTELNADPGAHRSFDEVDYPESGPMPHRKTLATLEEEIDDDIQSQDTTLPLESSTTASHSLADYMGHYPDLLDMTRTRAVSPTQLSYHSLAPPQFTVPGEWRYSYVHPADYSQYPVAYVPAQPRPGYVTLPRRHRLTSWGGRSSTEQENLLTSQEDGNPLPFETVYDTLGPRTTADGTSRTDLTRPTLHAAEPYTPHTPQSPNSPPSLPPYYTPINSSSQSGHFQPRSHSATLPRSTPNLLDSSGGLSLPYHETSQSHLASPTPSNASTVHAASPAYRTNNAIPHSSNYSKANNHGSLSGKSPADLRNESLPNSSKHNNNNNLNGKLDANASDSSLGSSPGPVVTVLSGKKVPPKPPPKPSASKRLSVSSIGDSRKSSVVGDSGRVFQDEGPDGTEV